MINKESESPDNVTSIRTAFFDYKLETSKKYIRNIIVIIALVNVLLLIPDMVLLDSPSKVLCVIMRGAFSLILLLVFFQFKNIKTFKLYSTVTTACELAAIAIFLGVLNLYDQPSFLIQTLGLITIILIVFLVPNRWWLMVTVNVVAAIGYFLYFNFLIGLVEPMGFFAGITYVLLMLLICAVFARNTEKHQFMEFKAKKELEHLSTIDYLTKTVSRLKLEEEAERWIKFCQRQKLPLSLIFFDIDNLKRINDTYDHATGDSVLISLAKLIRKQLRHSDILARWGGDEFVVLFPNVALDNAIILTERIRESIEENTFVNNINVTCSFGIVTMKDNSSFEKLVLEADHLMYTGKKQGKNHVQWSN